MPRSTSCLSWRKKRAETTRCKKARAIWILLVVLFSGSGRAVCEVFDVDISSTQAPVAIKTLSKQTGHPVIFHSEQVKDIVTNPVNGTYSVNQALRLLLEGTVLSSSLTKRGVITISKNKNNCQEGRSQMGNTKVRKLSFAIAAIATCATTATYAVEESKSKLKSVLEEVVVTATKKASAEKLQNVPISATAYSEELMDILHLRGLTDLSNTMPNVSMDDVGTYKGTANFSFRGLGVNSSIPSIDPTVGVFVDGVYLGTNFGVVFDQFDLASIEVLRGPQGVLFGRNVTGGAVVVNTKDPTEEFEGSVRASVETGTNTYLMGTVSGPIIEDKLLGKLALYRNDDDGHLKNRFDGKDIGESESTIVRGALTYLPNSESEIIIKYEQGELEGDGAISQNNAVVEHDSFDVNLDFPGFLETDWDNISVKYEGALGAGVVTNIIGWRSLDYASHLDVDATPIFGYHGGLHLETEQISEELRYNQTINDWIDFTAGLYYFNQEIIYAEERNLAGGVIQRTGGGEIDQDTYGVFLAADWKISEQITINTGIRYTAEEKSADIATVSSALPCDVNTGRCSNFDFVDEESWSNVTPKLGVQWFVNDDTQLYASYSKGYRSGGYNLRNTSPTASPGPFDEEEQNSLELGVKLDALDGRIRINAAAFHNEISDLQRETLRPDVSVGNVQVIDNTADATIKGLELEFTAILSDSVLLGANIGYVDGKYDEVKGDLNNDGVVDSQDKGLDIPRLHPLTAGVNLTWEDAFVAEYSYLARIAYSYKDEGYFNDANTGEIPSVGMVDFNVTFTSPEENLSISLFGRNLTDEVHYTTDTPLPLSPLFGYTEGGRTPSVTFLSRGRVIGAEVTYKF